MVVVAGRDFELHDAAGRSLRVAGHHFQFAVVVLARLGDVQVPHAVVRQLVSSALDRQKQKIELICPSLSIFKCCPYIDDSVSVQDPHHPGARVAGDSAAETGPFAFHHLDVLGLEDEDGLLL